MIDLFKWELDREFSYNLPEGRNADELFRLAIESALNGMILVDSHGKIVIGRRLIVFYPTE